MEILVTVEHGDGTAGVVRENDMPWLTGDVSRGPGTGMEGARAGMEGLRDGSLHGGMLPQGASGARVRDAAGNTHTPAVGGGAWVLVLPEAPDAGVAVSFLDADGALVRPELPAIRPRADRGRARAVPRVRRHGVGARYARRPPARLVELGRRPRDPLAVPLLRRLRSRGANERRVVRCRRGRGGHRP